MIAKNHYSKILLSKQELTKVYKTLKQEAETKLLLHLPNCSTDDPYRIDVENVLQEHLSEVFESAKLALIVDGVDLEKENVSIEDFLAVEPHIETVPYDPSINLQLRLILQKVEAKTHQVTRLRRELPFQARDAYEQLIASADREYSAILEKADLGAADEIEIVDEALILKDYSSAIDNLCEVRKLLPMQQQRVSSYNQVIDFLANLYEAQKTEV